MKKMILLATATLSMSVSAGELTAQNLCAGYIQAADNASASVVAMQANLDSLEARRKVLKASQGNGNPAKVRELRGRKDAAVQALSPILEQRAEAQQQVYLHQRRMDRNGYGTPRWYKIKAQRDAAQEQVDSLNDTIDVLEREIALMDAEIAQNQGGLTPAEKRELKNIKAQIADLKVSKAGAEEVATQTAEEATSCKQIVWRGKRFPVTMEYVKQVGESRCWNKYMWQRTLNDLDTKREKKALKEAFEAVCGEEL